VAILIGAGFAFKYAIDRGLLGPGARVLIGILVGGAFLAWGVWADRRGWERFSQAVNGGGIALLYLSILAAYHLYGLISGTTAFASLIIVTIGSAALAVMYDSAALAVFATFGGFLNPFLVARGPANLPGLYTYMSVLDLGVVGLAYLRRWRPLDFLAFAATWFVFSLTAEDTSMATGLGFATAFFALFAALPFLRTAIRKATTRQEDLVTLVPNALFYFVAGMLLLERGFEEWQAPFTLALAVAHLGLGFAAAKDDRLMRSAMFALCVLFLTAWIPIQFDDFLVTTGWAIKGILLLMLGARLRNEATRRAAIAVLALAAAGTVVMMGLPDALLGGIVGADRFAPSRLLVSAEGLHVALVIAALYIAGYLLRAGGEIAERSAAVVMGVAANALTLLWFTTEAVEFFNRPGAPGGQALQFSVSAIWGIYAAIVLSIGVIIRVRWPRLFAVAVFGLTILKMATVDLWLLETGFRVLAFIGLGTALLLTSLMYHQFRELILGPDSSGLPETPSL
jgi:uncharacterized membrane protein